MSADAIEQALQVFRRFLKDKDLKVTRQREVLVRRILEQERHFSAETLEEYVKGDGISKATIYRTLQLLCECGLVEEVALEDDRRMYEHIYGRDPHDHIVCVDCRKVFEFDGAPVLALEQEIAGRLGFEPKGHRLRIEGSCDVYRKTGRCDREEVRLS